MTRILLIVSMMLALGGCANLRQIFPPPSIAKIPASLKKACSGVVNIPDRDLTAADVAHLWAKDRRALGACARRHGALVKAVTVIEAGK